MSIYALSNAQTEHEESPLKESPEEEAQSASGEAQSASGEEKEGQSASEEVQKTSVELIREAIEASIRDQAHRIASEHIPRVNKTVTYILHDEEASGIRLGGILVFFLFFAVVALWCVCQIVKSAFRWLVNLVLVMLAIYLFFLIIEYLSVHYHWLGSTFGGSDIA